MTSTLLLPQPQRLSATVREARHSSHNMTGHGDPPPIIMVSL